MTEKIIDYRTKSVNLIYDVISTSDPRFKHYKDWFYNLYGTLSLWHKSEGNQGIKRMKQILNTLMQLALGEQIEPLSYVNSDSNKGFIPIILKPILPYLQRPTVKSLSVILTVSRLTDLFDGVKDDASVHSLVETISGPKAEKLDDVLSGLGKYEGKGFNDFVDKFMAFHSDLPFVQELIKGIRSLKPLNEGTHFSIKAGPNGGEAVKRSLNLTRTSNGVETTLPGTVPAFLSIYHDLKAIRNEGLDKWILQLQELIIESIDSKVKLPNLKSWNPDPLLADNSSINLNELLKEEVLSGKITQLEEKSGKIRSIAIGDYFSQTALKPIHATVFSVLKKIPNDCTFEQLRMVDTFKEWTANNHYVASFDQSSCTDLFPIELQLKVVSNLVPVERRKHFSTVLEQVLVGRDFAVKYPKSGNTTKVRYNRGQPMGLYGSWAMMAITHHMLVWYSHYLASGAKLSKRLFKDYAILGDDIVIADRSTSLKYLSVCSDLGMKINTLKSHITGKGTGVSSNIEFAKLNFWKGNLLNLVRPNIVLQAFKDKKALGSISLLQHLKGIGELAVSKKHCKAIIEKYFAKHRRVLMYLMDIPTPLGGLGYKGLALNNVVSINLKDGSLNPLYLYLAMKLKSCVNQTRSVMENVSFLTSIEAEWSYMGFVPEKYKRYYSRSFSALLNKAGNTESLTTDEALKSLISYNAVGGEFKLETLDIPKRVNLQTQTTEFGEDRDLSLSTSIWEKVFRKIDSYRVVGYYSESLEELSEFVVLKNHPKSSSKVTLLEGDTHYFEDSKLVLVTTPLDCLKIKDYILNHVRNLS